MSKKIKIDKKTKSFDYILLFTVIILVLIGLIMILSASSPSAYAETGNSYTYFNKQLLSVGVGVVALIICMAFDYKLYKKFIFPIYFIMLGLLIAVIFIGTESHGAKRWINIGLSFQPSEFAKLALVIVLAAVLTKIRSVNFNKGFFTSSNKIFNAIKRALVEWGIPLLVMLVYVLIIFIFQNHLSTSLILCAITVVMIIVAGAKLWPLIVGGIGGVFAVIIYLLKGLTGGSDFGFRLQRILAWLDPWSYSTGKAWQAIQGFYAIGSGGLFGVGLGQSKQKYLYIPEPHNDYIFTILAEEFGFVGCMVVMILFAIFIWRGALIAMKAPDTFGSLIAVGIVTMVGVQALINIGVVTGTIPVTGVTLPFLSYGGTSIIMLLASTGILLNISKHCENI